MNENNKPTLVLLCGLLCDELVWQDVAQNLNDSHQVEIYSFAGFSSLQAMADHVLANAPQQFALAGHSMGGRVALQIIDQAPNRVSHLALLNTGVHPRKDGEEVGRQKLLDLADTSGMSAVAQTWLPPMMGRNAQANIELVSSLTRMVERHSPEDFHGQIKALLNRPDATPFLDSVNVPTLLLSADEDAWSPPSQHKVMQELIPSSKFVELSNAGHMSICESPKEVSKALQEWLAR